MEHSLTYLILFLCAFLLLTGWIYKVTAKISFLPYTVALLLAGTWGQFFTKFFEIPIHFELNSDLIYFVLLPLLLFESAFHINFHQFRLQFKTITFLATFGLLLSIFSVGYAIVLMAGYPTNMAILFGAIISATDPIAVISLFKSLGAPKRLALVADGESMLNDATGVIAFKVVSSFVLASSQFGSEALFTSVGNFAYVFIGSMVFGAIVGYVFSRIIEVVENDQVIETTVTVAAALGSFVAAEFFFHFSGVISSVITGIVVGNLGKTKFSPGVRKFVEEFWSYLAFVSVSLVFFFATFNLDFSIFIHKPGLMLIAIFAVLIGRAVSVYVTCWLTNTLSFFKDEPNIPMSWQHILNWGGLRGVIPLVLVYSLPEDFAYRDDMLSFTMGAFLFTLLVNGLTIRSLLMKLGVHLPKKEESILKHELSIIEIEEAKESLVMLKDKEFDPVILRELRKELTHEEEKHKKKLKNILTPEYFERSLKLQALDVERKSLEDLYKHEYVSENVYFDFESELDLQQDALEYPEVFSGRAVAPGGLVSGESALRRRLRFLRNLMTSFPLLRFIFKSTRDSMLEDRIGLLKARILTSEMVLGSLHKMATYMSEIGDLAVIKSLEKEHRALISDNEKELSKLSKEHPKLVRVYQRRLVHNFLHSKSENLHP